MLYLDKDRFLFLLLLISVTIPGSFFEIIFLAYCIFLVWNNWKDITKSQYGKSMLIPVVGYGILFFVQFLFNNQGIFFIIRLYGITKCLCGLELSFWLGYKICQKNPMRILTWFIIAVVCIYIFVYYIKREIKVEGIGSINVAGCLCMIMLPHVLSQQNSLKKIERYLYVTLTIVLLYLYYSTTLLVEIILISIIYSFSHIQIQRKSIKRTSDFYLITSIFIIISIFLFVKNKFVYESYINLLGKLDTDHSNILQDAYRYFYELDSRSFLIGQGDNRFYHGMNLRAPHNAIMEIGLTYGILGIEVFTAEMVIFISILLRIRKNKNITAILASTLMGILYFMLHPFFTTSFLVKIVFITCNLTAFYLGEENEKKNIQRDYKRKY
ncbi:MAG: hypothetical protein HFG53_01760 [Lachnospiraceae bacterium]|jgi:hypothetical protein|nr:hypothetical protein [Lachnospiraceae bacterium]